MKDKYKITARYNKTEKMVDMEFYSIKQAKFFNPDFVDFEIKGIVKNAQRNDEDN